jgi:ABC-type transporter Mla subunit MlaD
LRTAGQLLETQAATFRTAAQAAAEAPQSAAIELDKQAKRIETVSDAAMARAEFLLGRHERHRGAMAELLQRLKDEGGALESGLALQRQTLEQAIASLSGQARTFETLVGETDRNLEQIMNAGTMRANQLTATFGREAERVKEICETAAAALIKMMSSLHEAGASAQSLMAETTSQTKANAKALVGETMGECQKLLKTANELSAEASQVKGTLANAIAELEKHLASLPGLAQQEAVRVRNMVRSETDEKTAAPRPPFAHRVYPVRRAPGPARQASTSIFRAPCWHRRVSSGRLRRSGQLPWQRSPTIRRTRHRIGVCQEKKSRSVCLK